MSLQIILLPLILLMMLSNICLKGFRILLVIKCTKYLPVIHGLSITSILHCRCNSNCTPSSIKYIFMDDENNDKFHEIGKNL